jgi:ubiquinone/menaquinone biosynthesis C-methylase UbiE
MSEQYNYQNVIFSPEKIHTTDLTHSGYINFHRAIPAIKTLPTKAKVLDIGCGAGAMLASLESVIQDKTYYGVDISEKAISYGKKTFKHITLTVSPSDKLNFPDSYFDAVIVSEVLEHVQSIPETVNEIKRVLKKGGTLYFTSPLEKSMFTLQGIMLHYFHYVLSTHTTGHINFFNEKDIVQMLEKNNFKIQQKSYSQHLIWQITMCIYQLFLVYTKKDIFTARTLSTSSGKITSRITKGVIKTISIITNIESMLLYNMPGSDIQVLCIKNE